MAAVSSERRTFDPAGHQRRLMPPLARTYALHFAQAELADRCDAVMRDDDAPEREPRELESLAAGMKATASWHAVHTIQACRECCGGAEHFGELDPVGTVTFVAGQAVETVIERLFARQIVQVIGDFVSRDDDDDLLAPADQLDRFRWREGHITASAAQRFKRDLDDGHESAGPLVDAFGIPDEVLGAPIGLSEAGAPPG